MSSRHRVLSGYSSTQASTISPILVLVYEVNRRVSGDMAVLAIKRDGEQLGPDLTFAQPSMKKHHKQ